PADLAAGTLDATLLLRESAQLLRFVVDVPHVAGGGLEILLPALRGLIGALFVRLAQIVEIRVAIPAADRFEMKRDVIGQFARQRTGQKRAELMPARTAQPAAPPDFADRMPLFVALLTQRGGAAPQLPVLPERLLEGRHPLNRKGLVEIGQEFGISEFGSH